MPTPHNDPITPGFLSLFEGDTKELRHLRAVHRGSKPFLLFPEHPEAALATLSLYAAQTKTAQLGKRLLTMGLRFRLPLPQIAVPTDPRNPFCRFLAELVGEAPGCVPAWGMLAGNPNTPGRRFLFLVFDRNQRPRAVVKTGLGVEAAQLVTRAAKVLSSLPRQLAACPPPLLGNWDDPAMAATALAMPFIPGESPSPRDTDQLLTVLTDWLRHGSDVPLASIPAWHAACAGSSASSASLRPHLLKLMADRSDAAIVRAPIWHGDFVPWNIKTGGGKSWTVIDWERSDLCGVPGWDWFHFVIQPLVLVSRQSPQIIADHAGQMLASNAFRAYSEAAKISGLERALLIGYLAYSTEVLRQSEGAGVLATLMEVLLQRWSGSLGNR